MNSLLAAPRDADKFPLVISQDAHDPAMTRLVELEYVAKGLAHRIHHEHEANAEEMAKTFGKVKHTIGYVRIAQHFGFVMRKMFDSFGFEVGLRIRAALGADRTRPELHGGGGWDISCRIGFNVDGTD